MFLLRLVVLALLHLWVDGFVPSAEWSAKKVDIGDKDALQMYQKWVDTGLSSIMAAVANKKIKKHRSSVANKFGKCSNEADTVPKQARCVSKLLRNQIVDTKYHRGQSRRMQQYGYRSREDGWTGAFKQLRRKRNIDNRPRTASSYDLRDASQGHLTPLGGVAKLILESVLAKKTKPKPHGTSNPLTLICMKAIGFHRRYLFHITWQRTVQRLKAAGERRRKMRKEVEESSRESIDQLAMRGMRKMMPNDGIDVEELTSDPKRMEKFIMESRNKPNKKPVEKVMDLLRDGMKLGYSLAGKNTSDFEKRSMKVISPRFFGLVPEEKENEDEIDVLSPSLFSLHNEGKGTENMTSLHNLLRGMPMHDQQVWLDLIMESAGVNEESDKLEKELAEDEEKKKNRNVVDRLPIMENGRLIDDSGTPLYFEKRNATEIGGRVEEKKLETFEKLQNMYTPEQLSEMNKTGYAFLTREQMFHLYGPHSPYNNTKTLNKFLNMNQTLMHDYVEEDIHALSEMDKFNIRQKDIVLSPILFTWLVMVPALASQPLVLSPVIFSPLVLSPSVFGAVILSPWMFVPLVLAPRVLGSLILSPFIFSPIILTPLALHPAILSPGVFNPLILSPSVLTPLILSPQVFTPIILSPLCLDPIILNPLAGSPLILSPFVLSPILASPQFLGGLILSPYALSPVLLSPLTAFAAVLSPSWLS